MTRIVGGALADGRVAFVRVVAGSSSFQLRPPGNAGNFRPVPKLAGTAVINARGEEISHDGRFWQNGKWFSPVSEGNTPPTGTMHLHDLNDHGVMLATAGEDASDSGTGLQYGAEAGILLPVELYSDLNNDGEINSADSGLVGKPYASGASEEEKDKGTEFMFANDSLSNGAWAKDDTSTPGKPADADDDDAEPIFVGIGSLPDETQVWLDHPASAGLKYYRDRKCTEEIPLSSGQPHVVGGSVEWPDDNILFVRAESVNFPDAANPQVEGDLKLMIKPSGPGAQDIEATKLRLTVVKDLGAKKYFHAAQDYILENNTSLFLHSKNYNDDRKVLITVMRERATIMRALDTYHHGPTKLHGIDAVTNQYPNATVIINGNMTFDRQNYFEELLIRPLNTICPVKRHKRPKDAGKGCE